MPETPAVSKQDGETIEEKAKCGLQHGICFMLGSLPSTATGAPSLFTPQVYFHNTFYLSLNPSSCTVQVD
jgi:hypothetical protein